MNIKIEDNNKTGKIFHLDMESKKRTHLKNLLDNEEKDSLYENQNNRELQDKRKLLRIVIDVEKDNKGKIDYFVNIRSHVKGYQERLNSKKDLFILSNDMEGFQLQICKKDKSQIEKLRPTNDSDSLRMNIDMNKIKNPKNFIPRMKSNAYGNLRIPAQEQFYQFDRFTRPSYGEFGSISCLENRPSLRPVRNLPEPGFFQFLTQRADLAQGNRHFEENFNLNFLHGKKAIYFLVFVNKMS